MCKILDKINKIVVTIFEYVLIGIVGTLIGLILETILPKYLLMFVLGIIGALLNDYKTDIRYSICNIFNKIYEWFVICKTFL